jgi:ABC-type sulfate transport system permease component
LQDVCASLLSNLGLLIMGVGAAWAMTQMTSSADKVALVQTALMLPVAVLSTVAGALLGNVVGATDVRGARGNRSRRRIRRWQLILHIDALARGQRLADEMPARRYM